jgi:hypothetical protein
VKAGKSKAFKGPLGSHKNFINHIALENYHEYKNLCGLNEESRKNRTLDKYKECRYFLNVIESMNNILDYLYFEHEDKIQQSSLRSYKSAVWAKYPELRELANLANAYKHCIREGRGGKNMNRPWAKDLQKPQLNVDVKISSSLGVNTLVNYDFPWPINKHERVLEKAVKFWMAYIQYDGCDLKNV